MEDIRRNFDLENIDSINMMDYAFFKADTLYTIKTLQNLGLISSQKKCLCGTMMHPISSKNSQDLYFFRCPDCKTKQNLRVGSIFEHSNLPLWKLFIFFVVKIQFSKITYEEIQNHIQILSSKTIADWTELLRSIITLKITDERTKIGGKNVVVQIDETAVTRRKYNVGRLLKNQQYWIVGGIDDEGGCFFELTKKRSSSVLETIILNNVEEESIIWTDKWRGYSRLNDIGFFHETVCHKYSFVSGTGVHTNKIEATWGGFKRRYRNITNKNEESLYDFISDYIFRKKFQGKLLSTFYKEIMNNYVV